MGMVTAKRGLLRWHRIRVVGPWVKKHDFENAIKTQTKLRNVLG
jgi:hypothetical protein